jgi:pyrroline-5-carboxylate reductase
LSSARDRFHGETGVEVFDTNLEVVPRSDVLIVAVKPQSMRMALDQIRPLVTAEHFVVSIAAGITIAAIVDGLGPSARVVRVMPNTPALVGEGASAYALGDGLRPSDEALVKALLGSVGKAVCVNESLLDAVTGLSGSGPAFVYLVIEALADGGVRAGLPRDVAALLATQTVLGAAKILARRHDDCRFACARTRRSARGPDRCRPRCDKARNRVGGPDGSPGCEPHESSSGLTPY